VADNRHSTVKHMMRIFITCLLVSIAVRGETPIRVVDTVTDLDALYPNIEQPVVMVRGFSTIDSWTPPKQFFWNPSSVAVTNDYIRNTKMGVGRWVHNTAYNSPGTVTIGLSNVQTALDITGGTLGSRIVKLTRTGVGTVGINTAAGSFSIWDDSTGNPIATFLATASLADFLVGGFTTSAGLTGRVGRVFAPSASVSATNEHLAGGNLELISGIGTGTGTLSRINFIGEAQNVVSPTGTQPYRTLMSVKVPDTVDVLTNNTGIIFYYYPIATNLPVAIRMIVTNEGGILRPIFVP